MPDPPFRTQAELQAQYEEDYQQALIASKEQFMQEQMDDERYEASLRDWRDAYPSMGFDYEAGPSRKREDTDSDED